MRLSEAIRLGAMMRPQLYGVLLSDDGSCALGAAGEASGYAKVGATNGGWGANSGTDFINAFSWLDTTAKCPVCDYAPSRYMPGAWYVVVHLNNTHRWTRERIADWVESVEPVETAKEAACVSAKQ